MIYAKQKTCEQNSFDAVVAVGARKAKQISNKSAFQHKCAIQINYPIKFTVNNEITSNPKNRFAATNEINDNIAAADG